jgi:serine/threonine protein kinase
MIPRKNLPARRVSYLFFKQTAFFSPELCGASYGDIHAKACDVWAIGVTLYTLIYAILPFSGKSVLELYETIRTATPLIPKTHFPRPDLEETEISAELLHLFALFFQKDPEFRITIPTIRQHAWICGESLPSIRDNCVGLVTYVSEEEVEASIKNVNILFSVVLRIFYY